MPASNATADSKRLEMLLNMDSDEEIGDLHDENDAGQTSVGRPPEQTLMPSRVPAVVDDPLAPTPTTRILPGAQTSTPLQPPSRRGGARGVGILGAAMPGSYLAPSLSKHIGGFKKDHHKMGDLEVHMVEEDGAERSEETMLGVIGGTGAASEAEEAEVTWYEGGDDDSDKDDEDDGMRNGSVPIWNELSPGEEPLQLGFRPGRPHVEGQALRTVEVQTSVTKSWEAFCDVAETILMGQRMRTYRPHVAQIMGKSDKPMVHHSPAARAGATSSSSSFSSSSSSSSLSSSSSRSFSSAMPSISRSFADIPTMFGTFATHRGRASSSTRGGIGNAGGFTDNGVNVGGASSLSPPPPPPQQQQQQQQQQVRQEQLSSLSSPPSLPFGGISWSGIRLTVGVTQQRLRTVVIEVLGPRSPVAVTAAICRVGGTMLSAARAAREAGVAGEVLVSLREAMVIESLIPRPGGHSRGNSASDASPHDSNGASREGMLTANDSIGEMNLASDYSGPYSQQQRGGYANNKQQISQFGLVLDNLYVLQLRAVFVAELSFNLSVFAKPLDDWLEDHEKRSRRLVHMLEPLHRRFMPRGPSLPPPPQLPSQRLEATSLSKFGLTPKVSASSSSAPIQSAMESPSKRPVDDPAVTSAVPKGISSSNTVHMESSSPSLIDRQALLFGAGNSSAAQALVRSRQVEFGAFKHRAGSDGRTGSVRSIGGWDSNDDKGGRFESIPRAKRASRFMDSAVAALSSIAMELATERSEAARAARADESSFSYVGHEAALRVTELLRFHATTPGGGLGCGWELATPMAATQAEELVEYAKAPSSYWLAANENERRLAKKRAYALANNGKGALAVSRSGCASIGAGKSSDLKVQGMTAEGVAQSLWTLLGDCSEREAAARMRLKQAAITARIQQLEEHHVAVVALLANRPIPPLDTTSADDVVQVVDPVERMFHQRFRVSNEPLLFDCAASLKVTQQQKVGPKIVSAAAAFSSGKMLRRENGRLYVTFSHLWFDSPGTLLKNESQFVLPFYTLHGLKKKVNDSDNSQKWGGGQGSGHAIGGGGSSGVRGAGAAFMAKAVEASAGCSSSSLTFMDYAGKCYSLVLMSSDLQLAAGVGTGGGFSSFPASRDFSERAADLILQLFSLFQAGQRKKLERDERLRTQRLHDELNGVITCGIGSNSASSSRPAPAEVDEMEILARVQRIAELSARNANLRQEFEIESQQNMKGRRRGSSSGRRNCVRRLPGDSDGRSGVGGPIVSGAAAVHAVASVGEQMFGHVESLFLSSSSSSSSTADSDRTLASSDGTGDGRSDGRGKRNSNNTSATDEAKPHIIRAIPRSCSAMLSTLPQSMYLDLLEIEEDEKEDIKMVVTPLDVTIPRAPSLNAAFLEDTQDEKEQDFEGYNEVDEDDEDDRASELTDDLKAVASGCAHDRTSFLLVNPVSAQSPLSISPPLPPVGRAMVSNIEAFLSHAHD